MEEPFPLGLKHERHMKNMMAVVFGDKAAAYEGVVALSALDHEHCVRVDSLAVIKKNADGTVSRESEQDEFPIGTVAWTALGGVVGLLGGPAGVAVGMGTGALIGFMGDRYTSEAAARFLADASAALTPGKYAIVADVDEESITAVDMRMQAVGGVVFRTMESSGENERSRQVAALRAKLDELRADHLKAYADRGMQGRLSREQARFEQAELDLQKEIEALQVHLGSNSGVSAA
jgi:uncharacterized membrane protein